jgi:beta-N-acetylhexosaminidase
VTDGLGGIALVGFGASNNLKSQIERLRNLSPNGVRLVIASDEEGGWVQRLRRAIYTLPSATTMGAWSDKKIRATAKAYGLRMKALGVDIAFSPVADLNVPGFFIAENRRGFSSDPKTAGRKALAWAEGLAEAGVVPTVKHWPGHGSSGDTHARPSILAPIETLQNKDLLPFKYAFEHGVKVAMVGHLLVPGLTETKTPTSRSPKALALLREQLGTDGVIVTDSLSMGGATKGLRKDIAEAAIRSLEAGVDIALVCTGPRNLLTRVTEAVDSGRLTRAALLQKVRRILKLKTKLGLVTLPPALSSSRVIP